MSNHPFYVLPVPGQSGNLVLTPCPGTVTGDLESAIRELKPVDPKAVLTLMTQSELQQNGASALPEQCELNGIEWFHLPVEDESAPADPFNAAWRNARSKVHNYLDEGQAIVIHCKGGSGRTGLVTAQILMERGTPMAAAINLVRSVRPNAFQHAIQREYLEQLAASAQA